MPPKWIEIKITMPLEHLETISSYLFALGSSGLLEGKEDFTVYFPQENWIPDSYVLLRSFCETLYPDVQFSLSEVEAENWNENWKKNFHPFYLTENCVIVPDWKKDYDASGAHKIIISPKMAFGTGHHETTKLILLLLPDFIGEGAKVLDAGTGSAILSIYAAQLGAAQITAFDTDPDAVENALENIQLNGLEARISARSAALEQIEKKDFDLILANINRNVLLHLAEPFTDFIRPGGILILSGLLEQDFERVNQTYGAAGWDLQRKEQLGEWLALVYNRKDGKE